MSLDRQSPVRRPTDNARMHAGVWAMQCAALMHTLPLSHAYAAPSRLQAAAPKVSALTKLPNCPPPHCPPACSGPSSGQAAHMNQTNPPCASLLQPSPATSLPAPPPLPACSPPYAPCDGPTNQNCVWVGNVSAMQSTATPAECCALCSASASSYGTLWSWDPTQSRACFCTAAGGTSNFFLSALCGTGEPQRRLCASKGLLAAGAGGWKGG